MSACQPNRETGVWANEVRVEHLMDAKYGFVGGGGFLDHIKASHIKKLFRLVVDEEDILFCDAANRFVSNHTDSITVDKVTTSLVENMVLKMATVGAAFISGFMAYAVFLSYEVAVLFNDNPDFATLHIMLMLAVHIKARTKGGAKQKTLLACVRDCFRTAVTACRNWSDTLLTTLVLQLSISKLAGKVYLNTPGSGRGNVDMVTLYEALFEDVLAERFPILVPSVMTRLHAHKICMEELLPSHDHVQEERTDVSAVSVGDVLRLTLTHKQMKQVSDHLQRLNDSASVHRIRPGS